MINFAGGENKGRIARYRAQNVLIGETAVPRNDILRPNTRGDGIGRRNRRYVKRYFTSQTRENGIG